MHVNLVDAVLVSRLVQARDVCITKDTFFPDLCGDSIPRIQLCVILAAQQMACEVVWLGDGLGGCVDSSTIVGLHDSTAGADLLRIGRAAIVI
jgi:hypothetical protein